MCVQLKIKQKTLATEAQIIRLERKRLKAQIRKSRNVNKVIDTINSLHWHNVDVVRVESRATHLARAFMKKTPYLVAEQGRIEGKEYQFWNTVVPKVTAMAKKYDSYHITENDVKNWIKGF